MTHRGGSRCDYGPLLLAEFCQEGMNYRGPQPTGMLLLTLSAH